MSFSIRLVPVLLATLGAVAATACSDDDTTPAAPTSTSSSSGSPSSSSGSTSSGGSSSGTPAAAKDIVDTAVGAGNFKTLVAAVQAGGLESTLRGTGPFTVFAPTDDAFAKLPDFLRTKLLTAPYKTELALILKYHVLPAKVPAADVLGKKQDVATVLGAKLSVDGANNKVVINSNVNVVTADVAASNGTIHALDGVLLPTIVDTAVGYDDGKTTFKTLVQAVTAADLAATLSGPGPFTVFAPTDEAFAALKTQLGAAAFDAILADKAKLSKILTYHVVGASVYEKDVTAGDVKTVQGSNITISTTGGVTIKDSTDAAAKVVFTDLPNQNGVIHVIDKVLLPAGL